MQRAKSIIKKNAIKKFYNEKEQLYLETVALGAGLRASHLQARDGMGFLRNVAPDNVELWPIALTSKHLTQCRSPLWQHRKRIPSHTSWPTKFHHHCLAHKVSMIPHHKLPIASFKK